MDSTPTAASLVLSRPHSDALMRSVSNTRADGAEVWTCGVYVHRNEDEPAIITPNGVSYFQMDLMHREGDKPAYVGADGQRTWYYMGNKHRNGYPANILANGDEEYYQMGKLHRNFNLPAISRKDGSREWYYMGVRHNAHGPAIIGSNGAQKWFLFGQEVQVPASIARWELGFNNLLLNLIINQFSDTNLAKDLKNLVAQREYITRQIPLSDDAETQAIYEAIRSTIRRLQKKLIKQMDADMSLSVTAANIKLMDQTAALLTKQGFIIESADINSFKVVPPYGALPKNYHPDQMRVHEDINLDINIHY